MVRLALQIRLDILYNEYSKSIKVHLVDDNSDIREVLSFYFELIDNGIEGLEAIRKHLYDLVFLDMAVPQFSGIEVIRSLKKEGIFELRNIVIFTASSDPR